MKKVLNWIGDNIESVCLLGVFITSIIPFFWDKHGNMFYTFIGFYWGFASTWVVYLRKGQDYPPQIYSLLGLIILALGVASFFVLESKSIHSHYSTFCLFMTTYLGGMGGMLMGGLVFGNMMKGKI